MKTGRFALSRKTKIELIILVILGAAFVGVFSVASIMAQGHLAQAPQIASQSPTTAPNLEQKIGSIDTGVKNISGMVNAARTVDEVKAAAVLICNIGVCH